MKTSEFLKYKGKRVEVIFKNKKYVESCKGILIESPYNPPTAKLLRYRITDEVSGCDYEFRPSHISTIKVLRGNKV